MRIKLVEEMLEVHYNSGQFTTALLILEQKFESAFEMYLRLAAYYGERGLLTTSHSRSKRYEIFYEFASAIDREHAQLYEEALRYDLYLRENAKSRPSWAAPLPLDKNERYQMLKEHGWEKKYCHAEPCYYPVEKIANLLPTQPMSRAYLIREETPQWLLFDYESRSPWTNEAAVVHLS
jgi:hypothetical protein